MCYYQLYGILSIDEDVVLKLDLYQMVHMSSEIQITQTDDLVLTDI